MGGPTSFAVMLEDSENESTTTSSKEVTAESTSNEVTDNASESKDFMGE